MIGVVTCGQVLACQSKKEAVPRQLRSDCAHLFADGSGKLSPRLKLLFKRMQGAQVQHARCAWQGIEKMHEDSQHCNDTAMKAMSGVVTRLKKAASDSSLCERQNAFVDVYNEHKVCRCALPSCSDM